MANKIHVLVADDDPMTRRLLGGHLAKRGFEIIYAEDGNEAREVARRMQPDIILLDYRMPVMDGLKTASYLKKEEETKHIPILLLTNEDFPVEGEKFSKNLGADGYLHKGEDFEVIIQKMIEVMEAYGKDVDGQILPPKEQSVAPH